VSPGTLAEEIGEPTPEGGAHRAPSAGPTTWDQDGGGEGGAQEEEEEVEDDDDGGGNTNSGAAGGGGGPKRYRCTAEELDELVAFYANNDMGAQMPRGQRQHLLGRLKLHMFTKFRKAYDGVDLNSAMNRAVNKAIKQNTDSTIRQIVLDQAASPQDRPHESAAAAAAGTAVERIVQQRGQKKAVGNAKKVYVQERANQMDEVAALLEERESGSGQASAMHLVNIYQSQQRQEQAGVTANIPVNRYMSTTNARRTAYEDYLDQHPDMMASSSSGGGGTRSDDAFFDEPANRPAGVQPQQGRSGSAPPSFPSFQFSTPPPPPVYAAPRPTLPLPPPPPMYQQHGGSQQPQQLSRQPPQEHARQVHRQQPQQQATHSQTAHISNVSGTQSLTQTLTAQVPAPPSQPGRKAMGELQKRMAGDPMAEFAAAIKEPSEYEIANAKFYDQATVALGKAVAGISGGTVGTTMGTAFSGAVAGAMQGFSLASTIQQCTAGLMAYQSQARDIERERRLDEEKRKEDKRNAKRLRKAEEREADYQHALRMQSLQSKGRQDNSDGGSDHRD
jgi:hypothetical protein